MKLRLSSVFAVISCVLLASCYPYNEKPNTKTTPKMAEKTAAEMEQQKIKEQRDKMKEKAAAAKKKEMADAGAPELPTNPSDPGASGANPTNPTTTPPVKEKRTEYPTATKAPGKEGFVLSPYNNKLVDVRDIAAGMLVQDPTYTGAGKGYFRVP
jgi:hypothetical protein